MKMAGGGGVKWAPPRFGRVPPERPARRPADPKENLPEACGAVWHFSSFQATRCDVLDDVLDDVRIRITNKSIRC